MLKVIVVDDHRVVRNGLKSLLANAVPKLEIVAEAASAPELYKILQHTPADLVLLDINLPEIDGLEATAYVKELYPAIKVLILSMLDNEQYVSKALAAGAVGYLTKSVGRVELLQAIHIISTGAKYISPELNWQNQNNVQANQPSETNSQALSERELKVLRLIAEGFTNEEIADMLFNSKRTIETHRQNILSKTKSKNTANLIVYAARHHLLD